MAKHRLPVSRRRRLLAAAGAVSAVLVAAPTAALAQTPTPPPTPVVYLPSVSQLCAATAVGGVNAELAAAGEGRLVGSLAPLAALAAADGASGVKLKAEVSLAQVRGVLGCGDVAVLPAPTVVTTPRTPAPVVALPRDRCD